MGAIVSPNKILLICAAFVGGGRAPSRGERTTINPKVSTLSWVAAKELKLSYHKGYMCGE